MDNRVQNRALRPPGQGFHRKRVTCVPAVLFTFLILSVWTFPILAQEASLLLAPVETENISAGAPALESSLTTPANWNVGFAMGAGFGLRQMGSKQAHDLAAATLHVGVLPDVTNTNLHKFLRRVELGAELWAGTQYRPESAYLVGLTPMVRYRFLPETKLTPFIDGGAGLTATDIGLPDLSTVFEFNLQAGIGVEWKWRKNMALEVRTRYMHLSNAHIDVPNHGANSILFSGGVSWFF